MKCEKCPALRVSGYEYPEEYCAAGVPESSMFDFQDGSTGCRYTAQQIRKRVERRDRMQDHQYDGIEVYAEESEGTEQAMRTALASTLKKTHLKLCYKSAIDGTLYEASAYEQREIPVWLRWAYEEEEEKVQKAFCDKCRWRTRYQKCTCCRRNRNMRDNYEEEKHHGPAED